MSIATQTYSDRDRRQREIVPPEKLARCHALVIGVGAIGRQVALQLAAVGIGSMDLIDFDSVEEVNLAPQAYWPEDLGLAKVEATARICRSINPEMQMGLHIDRFRRSSARTLLVPQNGTTQVAVFACVDSITTRGLIWEAVHPQAAFFADGRMSAEALRVLASDRPPSDPYYATTLFAEEQAHAGSCTAKSTVYTASVAAGLMLSQFTRWLRGMPIDRDVMLNLLSMELVVSESTL
jgi:sulfur carrier protein ThiS adenylyltransferase